MKKTQLPTINEFKQIASIRREHDSTITSRSASLDLLAEKMGYKDWNTLSPLLPTEDYPKEPIDELFQSIKDYNKPLVYFVDNRRWSVVWYEINYESGVVIALEESGIEPEYTVVTYGNSKKPQQRSLGNYELQTYKKFKESNDADGLELLKKFIIDCTLLINFLLKIQKIEYEEFSVKEHDRIKIGDVYYGEDEGIFFEVLKKSEKFIFFQEIDSEIIEEALVPDDKKRAARFLGGDTIYKKPIYGSIKKGAEVFRKKPRVYYYGKEKKSGSYFIVKLNNKETILSTVKEKDFIWNNYLISDMCGMMLKEMSETSPLRAASL